MFNLFHFILIFIKNKQLLYCIDLLKKKSDTRLYHVPHNQLDEPLPFEGIVLLRDHLYGCGLHGNSHFHSSLTGQFNIM